MTSVFAKTMLESAIVVSDWLLSCQKIRQPERYEEIFHQLYSTFRRNQADEDVYLLFLAVLDDIFDILREGQSKGFIKAGTVLEAAVDGNAEQKIEVEKSYAEISREAEDFLMFLLVFARTLDSAEGTDHSDQGKHVYNVITTLSSMPSQESSTHLSTDSSVLHTGFEDLRLKIMMSGFGFLPLTSPYRFNVCITIGEFAAKHNLFDKVLPYIHHMEGWVCKDATILSSQRRQLYSLIAGQLRQRQKMENELFPFVMRIVKEFDTEVDPTQLDGSIDAAVELLSLGISLIDIVTYDDIIHSKTVQTLQHTIHSPLLRLGDIFYHGDHHDFTEFQKTDPDVFIKYNLNPEHCLEKIRLLVLASMASSLSPLPSIMAAQKLSLKDISERLGISLADSETLAVRAISFGILDGQIDQMNAEIAIRSSLQRSFGRPQWIQLHQRLASLNNNITQILNHLELYKQQKSTPAAQH